MTDNIGIWLNPKKRPQSYTKLDWVNAKSLLEPIAELAAARGDEVLVDIGTGTGAILNHMAPFVRQAIGVDVSWAMLAQVRPISPNISLLQADVRNGMTELPTEFADLVTTRMMLHDVPEPKEIIQTVWHLVKPGGKLIASEYVTDTCGVDAVEATEAFETSRRDSSLLVNEIFADPSADLIAFHRELFRIKHEPNRRLWTANEFASMLVTACGNSVADMAMARSMTPYNSVNNWLGKSGYGIEVKQQGILKCLSLQPELQQELDVSISVHGKPVDPTVLSQLAEAYINATIEQREQMGIDAKIHRVFANVVLTKIAK